ncbi:MAG TPA: N-acetyl-alpha-D-glucosaminyl L-malate synthase BshA [Planctomycetota bacterium]|nr:N-acetyl-alpha-D-glucosaminyl L-malate synthase BshA [Planctomycetota bacterium]
MDSKLRIGILCHPTYGGSGVVASELALSLADSGHDVHVFSHDVPPRLARSPGPVQMHKAQGIPYPLFHSTPHDLAITSAILNVHRAQGLDVLHAHYALPHAVSAFLARSAAEADHTRPAPRVVTTLHGTDITLVGNDPSYAPLTQFVIYASDAATAVSEWLAAQTRERFCPDMDCPRPIEVIPNFIDIERFRPDIVPRPIGTPPMVVHVSNFRAVKRVPWLVRAFAQATTGTRAQLVLVGDGPDQAECRRLVAELGLSSRVVFLGERDAIPELMAPADVFALSSREESFGLSALEAMACGTPVVSTDAGGVREVVEHGVSGLLSPVDDLQAFSSHLRQLLSDTQAARRMGIAAREQAVSRFRREKVVVRYEDLYRRVLAAPRP